MPRASAAVATTGKLDAAPGRKQKTPHTHLGQTFFFAWGKLAVFRAAPDKKAEPFHALLQATNGDDGRRRLYRSLYR